LINSTPSLFVDEALSSYIEKFETKHESKNVEELMKLGLEAVEALSEALKKESKTQHEKSQNS
jgi:hypothetical protein